MLVRPTIVVLSVAILSLVGFVFPCFLVLCVMFCRSLFVLLSFFCHYVVCPSSIYGFWLPLWYLRFTDSDYPFGILDLRILITPLVSSNSPYLFEIIDNCSSAESLTSHEYLWYIIVVTETIFGSCCHEVTWQKCWVDIIKAVYYVLILFIFFLQVKINNTIS